MEKGSIGWRVYKDIVPKAEDKIIDKKFNSIFGGTELHRYLQSINANNLIMCGMQTEYCFDVSCKVAFEKEYNVIIPRGTTTTFDNDFTSAKDLVKYYEEKICNNRYARVLFIDEIIANLNKQ